MQSSSSSSVDPNPNPSPRSRKMRRAPPPPPHPSSSSAYAAATAPKLEEVELLLRRRHGFGKFSLEEGTMVFLLWKKKERREKKTGVTLFTANFFSFSKSNVSRPALHLFDQMLTSKKNAYNGDDHGDGSDPAGGGTRPHVYFLRKIFDDADALEALSLPMPATLSSIPIGDVKGVFGLLMILMLYLRMILRVLNVSYGTGTGYTALVYHHGKLLALSEEDKPYVIKVLEDGDLQSVGMLDYENKLSHTFTTHPKVDPFTDEMFTFGYSLSPPYVTYRVISKDCVIQDPVPITIPAPVIIHDFAITEHYAIFMDLPMYVKPQEMLKGKYAASFDPRKRACFGVLPRYAKYEHPIRWFELPNCFVSLHPSFRK